MISLARVAAVFRKELLQLRRDRLTFGMVIMIPLIQLILFGYAINTNVRHVPAGIVDHSESGLSRSLAQMVEATQVVDFVERFATVAEAEQASLKARVSAVLVLPPDTAARVARHPTLAGQTPSEADVPVERPVGQWIVDSSDTLLAASIRSLRSLPLGELLRKPQVVATPTFEIVLYYNPEQRTAVNIVPGLVGVILTMTMIMFTSAAIVREAEQGNMEMLINTPVHPAELMLGKIIPYVFIGLLQVAIILGLGYLVFSVPIAGGMDALLVITLVFILASLSLGLVISTIAKSQLQAMQMTVFVMLPSILLSGFMFPYEAMPKLAQRIADVLPATHFMRAIRGVVLRGADIADVRGEAIWLLLFAVLGLMVASLRFRKRLD